MDISAIKIKWVLWCLCISSLTHAQTEPESIDYSALTGHTLNQALVYLSTNHQINFSYNPEAIEKILVYEIPENFNTTSLFLEWVLYGTDIDFVFISNTYVLFPKNLEEKELIKLKSVSVNGRVIDKNTKEALPFAWVSIPGTKMTAITNTDGKFALLNVPSDTLTIHITYLGYMPKTIDLRDFGHQSEKVIGMVNEERYLPPIQVLAWKHEIIEIGTKPGSLVFNPAQIANLPNLGEKDVFLALRKLPGIRGGVDASSGLRIWGGGADQNLVLFDGITVYHVDHFYGFLSAFNSYMIKNIQLFKGAYSAKYGGRTAGVVNITGIDGNKAKENITIEGSSLSANMGVEVPLVANKASLVFAYRRSMTDVIQSRGYQNLFNNIYNASIPASAQSNINVFNSPNKPDYKYSDLHAKIHFIPSKKDEVALSFYRANDNLAIDFEGDNNIVKRHAHDKTQWGNTGGSVKWSRKWNTNLFTYGNFGFSSYKSHLDAEETFYISHTDTLLSKIYHFHENEVRDRTLRIDNTWNIDALTAVEFGYWNTHYTIVEKAQNQNEILKDTVGKMDFHALYVEFNRLFGKWSFTPGLRTSIFNEKVFFEPRFSFSHEINKRTTLKGSYGMFHQSIRRLNERSLYLSIPETWVLSNDTEVPVLQSSHCVLGVTYSFDDWQFDLEGYHKYDRGTTDFLFPEFGVASGNLSEFSIGGSRKMWGLDALVKKVLKNQYVMLGYSFLNSKTKYDEVNDGKDFTSPRAPAHEANLLYSYNYKHWDFSAAMVAAEGETYTPIVGTAIVIDDAGNEEKIPVLGRVNSQQLKAYFRFDIGANYTLALKSGMLQMGASIYNVLNTRSVKFIDYYRIPLPNGSYDIGRRDVLSLGITPSIFLKVKF